MKMRLTIVYEKDLRDDDQFEFLQECLDDYDTPPIDEEFDLGGVGADAYIKTITLEKVEEE